MRRTNRSKCRSSSVLTTSPGNTCNIRHTLSSRTYPCGSRKSHREDLTLWWAFIDEGRRIANTAKVWDQWPTKPTNRSIDCFLLTDHFRLSEINDWASDWLLDWRIPCAPHAFSQLEVAVLARIPFGFYFYHELISFMPNSLLFLCWVLSREITGPTVDGLWLHPYSAFPLNF